MRAGLLVVMSSTGYVANMVSKYKPIAPVLVVTTSERTAHHVRTRFGQFGYHIPEPSEDVYSFVAGAIKMGIYSLSAGPVVVVRGTKVIDGADIEATVEVLDRM